MCIDEYIIYHSWCIVHVRMLVHVCIYMCVSVSVCVWMHAPVYMRINKHVCAWLCMYIKNIPADRKLRSLKKKCLKYLIFALPNRHFCKPNCSIGKICVSWRVGFGFISLGHVDRLFLFLFKEGASALKLFFAGDGYADSHISTASISHRGEDLCSLNTTSWGWSFWQHSMRHRLFQCGNWFFSIPR